MSTTHQDHEALQKEITLLLQEPRHLLVATILFDPMATFGSERGERP